MFTSDCKADAIINAGDLIYIAHNKFQSAEELLHQESLLATVLNSINYCWCPHQPWRVMLCPIFLSQEITIWPPTMRTTPHRNFVASRGASTCIIMFLCWLLICGWLVWEEAAVCAIQMIVCEMLDTLVLMT